MSDEAPRQTPPRRKARRRKLGGRPTKLTQAVQDEIVRYLRIGWFFEDACRASGIAPKTGKEWLDRGEGRDPTRRRTPLYVSFAAEVRKASAYARGVASSKVYGERPLEWLRMGPGRPLPEDDSRGWTDPRVRVGVEDAGEPEGKAAVVELVEAIRKEKA